MKLKAAAQKTEQTKAGFVRVQRSWKTGDKVELKFDFALRSHFQTASDGVRWVAFSWGPLALAQSLIAQTDFPQNVLVVERESQDGNLWLEPLLAAGKASAPSDNATEELDTSRSAATQSKVAMPSWRLKTARKITMVTYFQAGAKGGSVRTMFPTRRSPL